METFKGHEKNQVRNKIAKSSADPGRTTCHVPVLEFPLALTLEVAMKRSCCLAVLWIVGVLLAASGLPAGDKEGGRTIQAFQPSGRFSAANSLYPLKLR